MSQTGQRWWVPPWWRSPYRFVWLGFLLVWLVAMVLLLLHGGADRRDAIGGSIVGLTLGGAMRWYQYRAANSTEEWLAHHDLIDVSEAEAKAAASAASLVVRIIARDGIRRPPRLVDFGGKRINVEVVDGRVSRVVSIG
jgi:hypothetical protein